MEINFDNPHQLVTMERVCAHFGMARSTVYRLVNNGELPPFFKIGKTNFVRAGTLEKFIEQRERTALAA
ncbi:MAG: helix-turn-helix transcriptional regulator [Allorhizobium sp.]